MIALKGVYKTARKDGSIYYRTSITYKNKHISLGSFEEVNHASQAYLDAYDILFNNKYKYDNFPKSLALSFEKWIVLLNYRDNGYYIKNPIYMHKFYFSYFIKMGLELEFDVDDLFYYSKHKIFKREGYFFVNDYGIQTNILSRYGIKNFAVEGKDFYFKDNNPHNMRYHNIVIVNKYYGVEKIETDSLNRFVTKIHILGNYTVGKYASEIKAAVAYNKIADYVQEHNLSAKNFPRNYIEDEILYAELYTKIKIPSKILQLKNRQTHLTGNIV
ncbi:MAG: hypothetical protein H7X94_12435 [Vallitaleaceae bacterium]|nr:hypothetical protein [Vallitaleaceae bacterium]